MKTTFDKALYQWIVSSLLFVAVWFDLPISEEAAGTLGNFAVSLLGSGLFTFFKANAKPDGSG